MWMFQRENITLSKQFIPTTDNVRQISDSHNHDIVISACYAVFRNAALVLLYCCFLLLDFFSKIVADNDGH